MTWFSSPKYHIRVEDVLAIQVSSIIGGGHAIAIHNRHTGPQVLDTFDTSEEAQDVAADLVAQMRTLEEGQVVTGAEEIAAPHLDKPLGPKAQAVLIALHGKSRSVEEVAHVIAAPPSYLHEHAVILQLQKLGAIERDPEGFRITEPGKALLAQAQEAW